MLEGGCLVGANSRGRNERLALVTLLSTVFDTPHREIGGNPLHLPRCFGDRVPPPLETWPLQRQSGRPLGQPARFFGVAGRVRRGKAEVFVCSPPEGVPDDDDEDNDGGDSTGGHSGGKAPLTDNRALPYVRRRRRRRRSRRKRRTTMYGRGASSNGVTTAAAKPRDG